MGSDNQVEVRLSVQLCELIQNFDLFAPLYPRTPTNRYDTNCPLSVIDVAAVNWIVCLDHGSINSLLKFTYNAPFSGKKNC